MKLKKMSASPESGELRGLKPNAATPFLHNVPLETTLPSRSLPQWSPVP